MADLGIIVLGQTPRTDLEAIYNTYLPGAHLLIGGALDDKSTSEIEALVDAGGEYPLLVILSDGTTREISLFRLLPLLERQAEKLAGGGVKTAVLMCAGDFPDLESPIPIIYPGRVVPAVVSGVSKTRRIGIVTPNPGQVAPAKKHWQQKGFSVLVAVASPKKPTELEFAVETFKDQELDLVVLDCMGFGPESAGLFREKCPVPVICAQSLVARVTAELSGW
jgi:protein AroM